MIDWPKVVQDLEKENARLKQDVEQFQMALREQVELNKNLSGEDVPTIAYMNGVAEGKKHADAMVAAAYRAAGEVCEQKSKAAWYAYKHFPIDSEERGNPHYQGLADGADECMQDIKALTTADAEKALREFWLKVAKKARYAGAPENIEQIVDEVMKG